MLVDAVPGASCHLYQVLGLVACGSLCNFIPIAALFELKTWSKHTALLFSVPVVFI